MYVINQSLKKPLHIQLYEELKKDIIENYKIDDKLPSIRKLANVYNLSKNTVESAFSQLVVEGYIDSFPKSGYVVTDTNYDNFEVSKKIESTKEEIKEEILYDFYPARLAKNSFPLKLWKRVFTKAVDESLDLGGYSNGQGEFGLRVEVAKYISESRAVNCNANQIVISNCFSDSMGLIAKLLKPTHKTFAIEDPGYNVAKSVFEDFSYDIKKISLDKNGINLEKIKESKTKLLYITPSHQYPTGVSIPISKRLRLLSWAKEEDAYIIEDDYDSELSYENRPIPSLQGLDNSERVIYLGTFSKSLSPSLRMAYIVLPKELLAIYKNSVYSRDSKVCLMTQKTLEKFMHDGHWERHLRKIRTQNKRKHNLMKKLLDENLGDTYEIVAKGAGLAILINPIVPFDLKLLNTLAKEEKMKLYLSREKTANNWQALRMGFGGFSEEELKKALEVFFKIWHKCIL